MRIIDNDVNTYAEVIDVCLQALPVTAEEAFRMATTVDQEGSCVVCVCSQSEADRTSEIIRAIGIEVRVEPWQSGG